MSTRRAIGIFAALLGICFLLAMVLDSHARSWSRRSDSRDLMTVIFGDARRMFANHFFVKADVYFHSGYYPSIFDQAQRATNSEMKSALTGEHHDEDAEKAHEQQMDFLGKPKDWIDRFGRNFFPSEHSHLDKPGEAREILPWLRISADLDPHRVETYTVAAYWLRNNMGKVDEAAQFLREGLAANTNSYEILFELGKLESESRTNKAMACNLWELGVRRWHEQEAEDKKPDPLVLDAILANLSAVEEQQGHLDKAIEYAEQELKVAPVPDLIQKRIEELKKKLGR